MKLWSLDCQRKQNDTNSAEEVAPKALNFFDLLSIGIGSSLAVGISVLIGGLIKNVTGPAVVVSVALAGLTALVAGLCFAEFGVRFLKVNSAYAYSYLWSSENCAFVFGWALILQYVAGTASAAKAIITFLDALSDYKITEFLKQFVSTNSQDVFPYFDFLSLVVSAAVTILYAFGKKDSVIVKKIFTICNIIFVVSVIITGGLKGSVKNWEKTPDESKLEFAPFGVIGMIKGAAIGFYGFIGFDEISVSGYEIKKRKRNLPLAIIVTIFITLLAYGGVGAVLSLMLPYYKLNEHAAVPFAFQEIGWTVIKWVAAVATFFGFQTSLFGAMYSLPRIIEAMANDGLLCHCLGNSHSVTKIPFAAAITGGLITAAAAAVFPFQKLVNLTVLGGLFVYTSLAISVILFRYSPKFDSEDKLSESWTNLINNDPDVSVKAVMQNYFNFKEKQPTNLTKIIIAGNIVLFCISSIGISIISTYFYDSLISYDYGAVIPAGILLIAMLFNLISMTCQPKCRETAPFQVPLIPFVPCLSIFLNILLMVTFESSTWILFSIWMVIGLTPHFSWRLLKYLRGDTGENSLYEINRTNAIKLNESIWKIKMDKKSFYQGAVNPVFEDELEDKFNASSESPVKKHNEKIALQLMEAEIIQTAEVMTEEKALPLDQEEEEEEEELNLAQVNSKEIVNDVERDEKVQWECVAEIHTEEEFPQESVVLEIVDNTYNFLSEVSDELSKFEEKFMETYSVNDSETAEKNDSDSKSDSSPKSEKRDKRKDSDVEENKQDLLRTESPNNKEDEVCNKNEKSEITNEYSNETSNLRKTVLEENLEEVSEIEKAEEKSVSDEHNKIKNFKEKLNHLLKNQVSSLPNSSRSSIDSKPSNDEVKYQINKDDLNSNVKTLNKSQIKGKLELLLAKGPPKRPSLGSSFNLKINETNVKNKVEKTSEESQKSESPTVLNSDGDFAISSSTLQDSIKAKILALRSASNNWTTDIPC